jgi:PAS domain S-box-containing protein
MKSRNSPTPFSNWQHLHKLILTAAGEGIYGLDPDGRATFANEAATRILGWTEKEVIGTCLHDLHHHTHLDGRHYPRSECPVYAALKDGEVHQVADEVFWHSNGRAIPVEYTSTPIWENGELKGAVVVFRDISERVRIESERDQAFNEINQLKELLEQERDYLREEIQLTVNFGEIIGESQALKKTFSQIDAVAKTPTSVLILGESGVGKEMVARAIHAHSDRAKHPMVKVNCASIPKELFESEFFGHVKGSFTGAHRDRIGKMQLANDGTLFLDEVGEIPLDLQSKLLRALQENEFERVGDEKTQSVDVRIIAATNRDLEDEVRAGRFREDLFYRLSVFPLTVPPLRERIADIAPLAQHFLNVFCTQLGRTPPALTKTNVGNLKQHSWPGNIRELKNIIERAVILTSSGNKLKFDIASHSKNGIGQDTMIIDPEYLDSDILTDSELLEFQKNNLRKAMIKSGWKISGEGGAARLLDIKPSTLAYRLSQLSIKKPD